MPSLGRVDIFIKQLISLYPKSLLPFDVVNKAAKKTHLYKNILSNKLHFRDLFDVFFNNAVCSVIDKRLHLY